MPNNACKLIDMQRINGTIRAITSKIIIINTEAKNRCHPFREGHVNSGDQAMIQYDFICKKYMQYQ